MNIISALIGSALVMLCTVCQAASVIILDEGINTQKKWDANNVTERSQVCSSLGTIFTRGGAGQPPKFRYLSLCDDQEQTQIDGLGASEYPNKKDYIAFGQPYEHQIFGNDHNGSERGEHGNGVSNALYDFDKTVIHRPMVVFGLELTPNSRIWRPSYIKAGKPYDEQDELPAWNIIRTLNYISGGSDSARDNFNQLTDLGAVNISLAYPGRFGEQLCANDVGQTAVHRLRNLGIAVVVGLENRDLPITQKSWPSCLDSVIAVGGLTGPGLGVGDNNITFFAKDTQDDFIGNSMAAPRVAAAYALLHERFPSSSLRQKHDVLRKVNKLRTRKTSVGDVRMPYIEKKNMAKAIAELEKIFPVAPLNPPDDFLDYSNIASWGPVYGGSQPKASFIIDLPSNGGAAGSAALANNAATDASNEDRINFANANLQGLPRDVLLEFTGAVHSGNSSAALRLWVNGRYVAEFKGFPGSGSANAQFVINRKYLNTGNNQIEIRPYNAGNNWGVKNVHATYLPIVPLQLGVANNNEYGYNGTPRYLTGMRATFNLNSVSSGGVELSMKGWDIDEPNETTVLVNGRYVGRLSTTANNRYGSKDSFIVSPAKLRQGVNYIELIQREPYSQWSGVEDEKWAVKGLTVKRRVVAGDSNTSALPAIISLLLDE